MPGKHTLLAQLDRYSKEFIMARMKLLHIFLNRVVNHPILSCDRNLHIFLTTKPAVSTISLIASDSDKVTLITLPHRNFSFTVRTAGTCSGK